MTHQTRQTIDSITHERGQTTLEALFASILVLSLTMSLLGCCYLGLLKISSEYLIHEALVCSVTVDSSESSAQHQQCEQCERRLKYQFQKFLLFQKIESVKWTHHKRSVGLTLTLSNLHIFGLKNVHLIQWRIEKTLALPLQ